MSDNQSRFIPTADEVVPQWERPATVRGKVSVTEQAAIRQLNAARQAVQELLIDRLTRLEADNDRLRRTAERTDAILTEQANDKRRLTNELEQARLSYRRAEVVTTLVPLVLTVAGQLCAATGRRITSARVGYEDNPTVSYRLGDIKVVHHTGSAEVVIDADTDEAMTYTITTTGLSGKQIAAIAAYVTDDKADADEDESKPPTPDSPFAFLYSPDCGNPECDIHGANGLLSLFSRTKPTSVYGDPLRDTTEVLNDPFSLKEFNKAPYFRSTKTYEENYPHNT